MRQTIVALLVWAKQYRYPYLTLSETDYVRHGELHWRRLARDPQRRKQAWERIEIWQRRLEQQEQSA